MKENEIYSIINKINELQLVVNTFLRNNDFMETAEKNHGFKLSKPKGKKHYIVRYKDPESNKWLDNKTDTGTDKYESAVAFAIENKESIIKEYKKKKASRKKQTDQTDFYQMLNEYYTEDSKYLKDDSVNKKRDLSDKLRNQYLGIIKNHFIPYFEDKKINSIQDITNSVYSEIKIYLTEKLNSEDTINNVLIPFNRILHYHERNEIISKLPYGKGLGSIRVNKTEPTKNDRFPLPTEYIKNILTTDLYGDWNDKQNLLFSYMLGIIGLTTGLRNSEIARIQKQDIFRIKDTNIFILKAYNHKTEYYNTKNDKYRKIPLHPFVVEFLKFYIKEKRKEAVIFPTSFLFGKPKMDKNGKIVDGRLNSKVFDRAIKDLYKRVLMKQKYNETGNYEDMLNVINIEDTELEKIMEINHIKFYSLRHTFNTLCVLFSGLKTNETNDIIDYFMGHKINNAMRANYTHINKIDNETFFNDYGYFIIEMLNKYIFITDEERQAKRKSVVEAFRNKIKENQHLVKNDRIMGEDLFEHIFKPLFNKEIKENVVEDDIFESI